MDLFTYVFRAKCFGAITTHTIVKETFFKLPPYTLEGFDLTTHNSKDGDDATM
jgi:hypothetical protein